MIMAGKGCSVTVSSSLSAASGRATSHMREVEQLGGKSDLKPFLNVLPETVKAGAYLDTHLRLQKRKRLLKRKLWS